MHHLVVWRVLALLTLWAGSLSTPALAADEPVRPAAPAISYTSRSGDTLEKIASQQYPGSPLQTQVLARMLLDANATSLGQTTPRKRLKPGTVLDIPSHELMLRKAVAPHLPAEALQHAQHCGPEARKRWVHYP